MGKDIKTTGYILITGCSSGIGLAIARHLADGGYKVIATVRNPENIGTLEELDIPSYELDLSNSSSIIKAWDKIRSEHGEQITALVNNGAYGQPGAVEDLSRAALEAQFQTNVFGTQELTNLVLPVMLRNDGGRIIQLSSILGIICLGYRGAYNASKYALEALTDTMRLEFAETNIRFSLIEPGPITSRFRLNSYEMYRKHIDAGTSRHGESYRALEERLMSGKPVRFTLPAEVVAETVKLAIESPNPKIRYRVTVPTRLMAPLKRLLPDRLMDRFLARH